MTAACMAGIGLHANKATQTIVQTAISGQKRTDANRALAHERTHASAIARNAAFHNDGKCMLAHNSGDGVPLRAEMAKCLA